MSTTSPTTFRITARHAASLIVIPALIALRVADKIVHLQATGYEIENIEREQEG